MRLLVTCLALLPLACGGKEEAPPGADLDGALADLGVPVEEDPTPAAKPGADLDRFKLASDPGAALSVNETKEKGPGDEVTVVGRLNRVVKGFATFNLVDASLEYCGQATGKKCCDTPWDYC